MKTHLEAANLYWKEHVKPGDTVIDATCGNGHDTLFLAQLLKGSGSLIGYDIQIEAIQATEIRLQSLSKKERQIISLKHQSHIEFSEKKADLIVYNLGYLPGGNKTITTQTRTTLQSLKKSLEMLNEKGAISMMCYPGHEEGGREQEAILSFLEMLSSKEWTICHHRWLNRRCAPTLIWLKHGT